MIPGTRNGFRKGPFLFLVLLLLLGVNSILLSIPAQAQPQRIATDSLLVGRVSYKGNFLFSGEELATYIRTRPNRRLLRLPGFTWWLWLHQLGQSGLFGQRLGQAFVASGEPPAYLKEEVLQADAERLRLLYTQAGYRSAEVDVTVDTLQNGRLSVSFLVHSGQPTYLSKVTYDVEGLLAEQKKELVEQSILATEVELMDTDTSFLAVDRLFSESEMLEERRRILGYLRDGGFAAASRDSIRALVFTNEDQSLDVTFRVRPGLRHRFDDIFLSVTGPEAPHLASYDTLYVDPESGGVVSSVINGERILNPGLLMRTLQFRPGEWYNQSKVLATKRRLEATGVFDLTRIDARPVDSSQVDEGTPTGLPHFIELQTRERHQMLFETFMLQRIGVLAASDVELGTGLGVTYENVNLFGQGEAFRIGTTGSVAADIDSTVFTSGQAEINTSLTYPYLIAPFRGLERTLNLYDARSQLSLSFLTARREELRLVIRGRGNARFRIEMQHTPVLASVVDLFDVSLSNPDTLSGFKNDFLDRVLQSIEDPIQRASVAQDYSEPQINSALRYTLRAAQVNPLRRERGYSYESAFELGSNLPYLLDRYVFSPDQIEGWLPGIAFFSGEGLDNQLFYRQYVRFSADFRRYTPISPNAVFAWKAIGGFAHPTGKARSIPFDRRFFSGGSSSVRGWGLRELGPGRSIPDSTGNDVNLLGGDIKLEASVELRSTVLRNVLAADWIMTFFSDAGNVWFGPRSLGDAAGRFRANSFYKDIGLGAGFGVRLAWEYLILRLDMAYRVVDPADGITDNPGPRLHFGIGHAF